MPWTRSDQSALRRLMTRYPTATEAAEALGVTRSGLSRYLSGERKPGGKLLEAALRDRISALNASLKKVIDESSTETARPDKST